MWPIISDSYAFIKSLLRNKEVLFWLIAFPVIFLTILVLVFASPSSVSYDVGIVGNSSIMSNIFGNISFVNPLYVSDEDTLLKLLRNGTIDVGLVLDMNPDLPITGNITIYYIQGYQGSEIAYQTILGILNGVEDSIREQMGQAASSFVPPQARKMFDLIINPIEVSIEGIQPEIYGTPGGVKLFYVVSMIGAEVIFTGLISGIISLQDKKRFGTLKILVSSPARGITFLISETLAIYVGIFLSMLAILGAGYVLGADYSVMTLDKFITITALTIVSITFMTGLGLILSLIPKTYEGAMALANMLSFPLLFVGGIVIPEFLLPDYLKAFADVFPLSRLVNTMRKILIFNIPYNFILGDILYGLASAIIVYLIGAFVYRRLLTKMIEYPI